MWRRYFLLLGLCGPAAQGVRSAQNSRLPRLAKSPQPRRLRRGELRRFVALWIRPFWRRAGVRNDESPAWRPGLSSLGALGGPEISNPNLPRFPEIVNSKALLLRTRACGLLTAAARTGRPSHRDGHGASIRLRLRGAPARTDPPPQPPARAL